MNWRKRRERDQEPSPNEERPMPITAEQPVRDTSPEEIERAEAAARVAALDLYAARQRRDKIDELADEIKRLNRENGFSELVRRAFRS
jgi:hypothetical protein